MAIKLLLVQLLILLSHLCNSTVTCQCELPIRRSRVLSSWQSSFGDGDTCFYNRSQQSEDAVLKNASYSYRFFHSHDKSYSDSGYHWFAVQLSESVLVTSVTVKGREDTAASVYNRTRDIEIWTSNSERNIFSGHHCWSRNMSHQFRQVHDNWTRCGVTKSSGESVTKGENLTVSCTGTVKHLMLRKPIATGRTDVEKYMSFADLRLRTESINITAPKFVAENSSFTVECSVKCNKSKVQLCFPNNSCIDELKFNVVRAMPHHSGSYKCQLNSVAAKVAAVLVLSSSPSQVVAENSNFTVHCSLYCNQCELCQLKDLELCFPNGSCISQKPGLKIFIFRTRPQDSGNYTCKSGTLQIVTSLTVLSSSPYQVVSENTSFTVNCSLFCNYNKMCADSARFKNLKLCFPNRSCIVEPKVNVIRARPQDSGNYTCTLNSLELSTRVTVLHPPSNVFIAPTKSNNCKNPTVNFTSSSSNPVAMHVCTAAVTQNGSAVRNLTLTSVEQTGGQWQLDAASHSVTQLTLNDAEMLSNFSTKGQSQILIRCCAIQNLSILSMNPEWKTEHCALWTCDSSQLMACNEAKWNYKTLTICIIVSVIVIVIIIMPLSYIIHGRFSSRREEFSLDLYSVQVMNALPDARPSLPDPFHEPEPACTYLTVIAAGVAAGEPDVTDGDWDTECNVCVFLDIVADGELEVGSTHWPLG